MSPHAPARDPVRLLVVDDDNAVREVLVALLEEDGYDVRDAPGADAGLAILREFRPELVLSDMKMPGKDGLWFLGAALELEPTLAVVMLTGYGDTETAVECLRRGAMDYLLKPPRVTDLVRSVERALSRRRSSIEKAAYQRDLEERVREKTAALSEALAGTAKAYSATLDALVAALDAREHETSDHSQRVVRFTLAIAQELGIPAAELDEIGRGALLHDIGKIGVADSILLKPGPLTPDEWLEMRRHPEIGHQIISGIPFLVGAAAIVVAHQERWDGTGYPRKLQGKDIPLGARIFAIADTLDAIVTTRPYRKGQSFEAARGEILRCAGTQFDPSVVDAFARLDLDTLRKLHGG